MKKLIMLIMALATLVASFASVQNSVNKNNNTLSFQLQVVVNNNTSNVDGTNDVWFYFNNFYLTTYAPSVNLKNVPGIILPSSGSGISQYHDVFATNLGTSVTIFNWNIDSAIFFDLSFNFGTFYKAGAANFWYHAQLVSVANTPCSFIKQLERTGDNGMRIVISANGGTGANSASWKLLPYKFES